MHKLVNLNSGQGAAQVAHGPPGLKQDRLAGVDVMHEKGPARQAGYQAVVISRFAFRAVAGTRALQPLEHTGLVLLCLQLADKPGSGIGQCLVIEVDRVLCYQYTTDTERPGLLEQCQEGAF